MSSIVLREACVWLDVVPAADFSEVAKLYYSRSICHWKALHSLSTKMSSFLANSARIMYPLLQSWLFRADIYSYWTKYSLIFPDNMPWTVNERWSINLVKFDTEVFD